MKKLFLISVLLLVAFACASSFNKRTAKRTVTMKKLQPNSLTVGIENENVLILFERSEIVDLFEKQYKKEPVWEIEKEIKKLKTLSKDSIATQESYRKSTTGWDYELIYYQLLKKGKAQITEKLTGRTIDQILYTQYKTQLGGQDAYFSFKNGTEFYKVILALGE